MENKNSSSGSALLTRLIKALITIVVMGIFFGLFLYEPRREIKDKENSDEDVIKTDVEILEVVDEEVLNLYETISSAVSYYCGVDVYYTDKKVTVADIDNKLAFNMALNDMVRDDEIDLFQNPTNIKASDMEEKIASILGKDYEYTHGDYSMCPSYPYNSDTKEYEYKGAECGGTCGPGNLKKIVKAVRMGDYLDVYVRILFINESDEDILYYSDYKKTDLIEDLGKDYFGNYTFKDNDYSKGSLYKIRFEKEDDNMIFVSSELVKD